MTDAIEQNLGRIRLALQRKLRGVPTARGFPPATADAGKEQKQHAVISAGASSYMQSLNGVGGSVGRSGSHSELPGAIDQGIWRRLKSRLGI